MRFRVVALLMAGLGWTGAVRAQDGAAGKTVIRTETRLVLVDTVVTDKKGNYVRDLTAKDFRVWEDGKEQPVSSFSFENDPAARSRSEKRYMILYFDNSSMDASTQAQAKLAATKFLDQEDAGDRVTAVMDFGVSLHVTQNFTSDIERLKQAVNKIGPPMQRFDPRALAGNSTATAEFGRSSAMGRSGPADAASIAGASHSALTELYALQSMARNLASVPGRKTLIMFSGGFPLDSRGRSELTNAINLLNRSNIAIYPIEVRALGMRGAADRETPLPWAGILRQTSIALAAYPVPRIAQLLLAAFEWQAQSGTQGGGQTGTGGTPPAGTPTPPGGTGTAPGGSTSPGGNMGTTPNTGAGRNTGNSGGFGNSTGTPGRGGTGGPLYPGSNPAAGLTPNVMDPRDVLYALAEGTGGFVIRNTNDLGSGMQKIVQEQHDYYLIGYTPPELAKGNCHSLKVKVGRSGTVVRSRNGYCNVKPRELLAGTPVERNLEARIGAAGTGTVVAALQVPFFYTAPQTARASLALDLPPGAIRFEKVKGKLEASLNVLAIAYRADGEVAARFSDTAKVQAATEPEADAISQKAFHYDNQFDIAAGSYNLKVAFSQGGETFGRLEIPLVVDAYDGTQLALSGLALSRSVEKISAAEANLDAAMLEGRAPLVAQNNQYTPSGTNRFKRTGEANIYAEVYEPSLLGGTASPVAVRLMITNRKSGEQVASPPFDVTKLARPGTSVIPIGMHVPVNVLQPGSYRVELQASNGAGKLVTRSADIEVE